MSEDAELLRQYAQSGSETAFAELVGRYLPLVYATALRQGRGDEALAKDVAQTVFIDLARKANSLLGRELLAGWLYTGTRLAASKAVRGEQRRHLRERVAASMQEHTTPPDSHPDQDELRLVLDEAMSELGSDERNAVLIRFFQGKELKEVGSTLGISEDAARMRITRALANLQTLLKQRGVTITTVALGTALATEAVASVPAGLAANVAATALASTAAAGSTLAATKAIAMTTLQKTVITAAFAVAVGTGIYEARQAASARDEAQTLRQQLKPLTDEIQQLHGERDETARQLASLREENEKSNRNTGELLRLRGEVGRLRLESGEVERLRAENHRLHVAQSESPPVVVGQGQSSTSNPTPLYLRRIKVDTEALLSRIMSSSADYRDTNPDVVQRSLLHFLKDNGVQIEQPGVAFLIDQTNGTLSVRASLWSLDKIETLLQDLGSRDQSKTNGGP